MRNVEIEVELVLTKHLTVEVGEYEDLETKVIDQIYKLESENYREYMDFLGSARLNYVSVDELDLRQFVRFVIDHYDPMVLEPWDPDGAPEDEYDYLSDRIYRKLTPAYTVEQIGELIGKEFHRSFQFREFPLSETIYPARQIYNYLHS